jgi:protein TonB
LDYSPTMIREDPGIAWDGPVGSQVIPNFGATFSPANLAATTAPPTKAVMTTPKPVAKPVQVGGDVQAAKLIRKVVPVYPRTAVIARISGTVRLQGIIGRDGTIQQLQVVSGHPLLTGAALAAVRQWLYRPTLLNGEPVEVIAPIDVNFLLSQ